MRRACCTRPLGALRALPAVFTLTGCHRVAGNTIIVSRIVQQTVVPPALAGYRVDRAAAELFPDYSRMVLTRWINAGELRLDGRQVAPKLKVFGGETLQLDATQELSENWAAGQPVAFRILFEDDDLLVVDKPAGVVVHPGAGNPDGTLVNGLVAHRPQLAQLPRAGLVHRIDKDTSGLLAVAASLPAHTALVRAIAKRRVRREYVAVVEGVLTGGSTIDKPIGRDPRVRTRQAIREDGKEAITTVRVLERFAAHTLIEAQLQTGRTHQIRVHLAAVGHPLVGDRRYGARGRLPPAPTPELLAALRGFGRQALHARTLAFVHPVTGADMTFTCDLPDDLSGLLAELRTAIAAPEDGA